ncbi:MAG TPA: hypothetical protein VFR93_00615, partial [Candidatus Limnocylindrales bacterium]|nr:hypothetical protein [Candidatus Limnocylindrales bacterium]
MTVILAVVVLALMAAGGILLLSWGCPFLTRAERFGYGAPLGMVLATDAILLLADATGSLSRVVVLAGTAIPLVVGFALAVRRGRLEPPSSVGDLVRSFVPRDRGTWLALAIVAAFAVRWALFWPHAVDVRPDGIYATHVNVWGDYPVHLGNVASFVEADNFPPTHPRFAGVPFGYHYLVDLTAAALVPFGLSAAGALELHSFVLSVVAAVALFAFARAITGSSMVGAVGLTLFLLGGGLGWINTVQAWLGNGANLPQPPTLPWDYRWKVDSNFEWVNMYWAFWMSQRAFLYGMPMAFAILRLALEGRATRNYRLWAGAGLIAGLLPLAHLGTLLALAIVVPVLFLLLPSRGWILFGVVWVVVAVPQLLSISGGGAGALGALRLELGWVSGNPPAPDPWPVFWIKNQGAFLVLSVIPLLVAGVVPSVARRLLLAFWAIWVLGNVFAFGPWDWDNHKILVYWFLSVAIASAAALVWLWRRFRAPLARIAMAAVVVTMVASSLAEDVTQALGESTYRMLDAEEVQLGEAVAAATPPHAVFLDGMDNHDPVQMIAGRTLWVGYANWLWAEGQPYIPRQNEALEMLRWNPGAESMLAKHRIDYVVIGPLERQEGANEA